MKKPDFQRIKKHYELNADEIFVAQKNQYGIDPYAWDFEAGIRLTPIEEALWHDIRNAGLVMYPQYPVGRYFVDFGNPIAKIAIECDGAAFHRDASADQARQSAIEALGWVVYRITGSDCIKCDEERGDEYGSRHVRPSKATLLVRRIADLHGISYRYCESSLEAA